MLKNNTKYNPKYIEKKVYNFWEKNKLLKNYYSKKKNKNFSIVLPPPNITGKLHIGNSFQHVIMDFLIRFNKMNNKNVLWQPGLDHAGIATQILIENKLKNCIVKKDKNKFFIKNALDWKKKISRYIIFQIKKLGNLIDFNNFRFTMDKKSKYSVKYAFVELYKKNLIYKKKSIINWDIRLNTTISDLEITNKNIIKKNWYIKYKILENNEEIIIPTFYPEYIFATSCIISSNEKLKNKNIIIPIINRSIPIIYDKDLKSLNNIIQLIPGYFIDHYKLSVEKKLDIINITDKNLNILKNAEILNENSSKFNKNTFKIPKIFYKTNLYQFKKIILKNLIELNLIIKKENKIINIKYNTRSESEVINLLRNQWYLKTKEIYNKSINIIKKKYINFYPIKYKNYYINNANNIKDWCISRQIWWGHKIPAWYDKNNNIYVGINKKKVIKEYKLDKKIILKRDRDVLDTWFSSGIWIFSSLGWPKNTKKIKNFYPTNLIISGNDIIFTWISRMIILSTILTKNIPFKKIYITGIFNDKNGKKISKSNNNIINPINIINCKTNNKKLINKYNSNINYLSVDSLRLTLLSLCKNKKNISFDINKVYNYENFLNKIWNSSLFIINNCKNTKILNINKEKKLNNIYNIWINYNFKILIYSLNKYIKEYKFDNYINKIYNFFWNKFCKWYIEISKYFIFENKKKNLIKETEKTLLFIFINILKVIYPVSPFISEYIWQILIKKIKLIKCKKTISLNKFPNYINKDFNFCEKKILLINDEIKIIQKIITEIRKNISYSNIYIYSIDKLYKNIIKKNINIIKNISKYKNLKIITKNNKKNIFYNLNNKIFLINK